MGHNSVETCRTFLAITAGLTLGYLFTGGVQETLAKITETKTEVTQKKEAKTVSSPTKKTPSKIVFSFGRPFE